MTAQSAEWPSLDFEFKFGYPERTLMGCDEVGRGCIAGPVVAAVAVLPVGLGRSRDSWNPQWIKEIRDSKKLTAQLRAKLSECLKGWLAGYAIAHCTSEEIDEINIHQASLLAMARAVERLSPELRRGAFSLVDGKWLPKELQGSSHAIIGGDLKSLSIACASILAKVHRDEWMEAYDLEYPGYGHAKHKGYPTPAHKKALQSLGVTPIHRKSFAPVMEWHK